MFGKIKTWWKTPAKHSKALAIGGLSLAATGVYALVKIVKNT